MRDQRNGKKEKQGLSAIKIDFVDKIPKCISRRTKYPSYEDMQASYDAINRGLSEAPVGGNVILASHDG